MLVAWPSLINILHKRPKTCHWKHLIQVVNSHGPSGPSHGPSSPETARVVLGRLVRGPRCPVSILVYLADRASMLKPISHHYCTWHVNAILKKIAWFRKDAIKPPYEIVKPYCSRTFADHFLDMSTFASNFLQFFGAARQMQDSRKAEPWRFLRLTPGWTCQFSVN